MAGKLFVQIDVQNLYHSSLNFSDRKISFKNLLEEITKGRELVAAKAYAAHRNYKSVSTFYRALENIGITVRSKNLQVKKEKTGVRVIPVHFDVEMTIDALCAEGIDTVVLCTGNGNFEPLVEQLLAEGMNVEVWSFPKSTSERLIKKAKFVAIPESCLLQKNKEEEVITDAQ